MAALSSEEAWLEQLEQSKLIGIAFLDADGKLMTRLENDPYLRDSVLDSQRERVRQLRLSEGTTATYPNLEA